MATYKISGVWINANKVITHYAFHSKHTDSTSRAQKTSKVDAIRIVETPGNVVYTWVWNYEAARFENGERVEVVNGAFGKYLRSNPDKELTDNLQHLIDFDWIAP